MRRLILFGLIALLGCSDNENAIEITPAAKPDEKKVFHLGQVYADIDFSGARLNEMIKIDDSTYEAFIHPENEPINNSPWYGFRLWSEKKMKISLGINYKDGYTHRYIPKLSHDGISWEPLEEAHYEIDKSTIRLRLTLPPEKLWISAQENLNYDRIDQWLDSLSIREYVEKEVIGKSVLGRPINLLKVKNGSPEYALILIGRQHPPEVPGGTISLVSFIHTILADAELSQKFRDKFEVIVIPLLNPDGVDEGNWRSNANGIDLNRDWIQFSQPETKAVKDWVFHSNNDRRFVFGIDFHTSYSGPYLLTLDTLEQEVEPQITSQWITSIKDMTGDTLDIRPRPQSLPYCYNWFINEMEIEAVTFEEGDEIDRKVVRERAQNYAMALMEVLMEEFP
ncbi:MAG: M14 family metallopeptidase [Cyclobacteriaceae bacterium]